MSQPIPVVTCTIYYQNKFLVIRRHDNAKKFGGIWGFPGGKIEQGETIVEALKREVKEETNLDLEDSFLFIDSYYYGDSIGMHFAVYAKSNVVTCESDIEHQWLNSLGELQKLPRIPGIDYHIIQDKKIASQKTPFLSLNSIDYTPDKYTN